MIENNLNTVAKKLASILVKNEVVVSDLDIVFQLAKNNLVVKKKIKKYVPHYKSAGIYYSD